MTSTLEPVSPRCDYLINPLGIGREQPHLSWLLTSAQRAQSQSAYRILVASSQEGLLAGGGDLWDSGRVESRRTSGILYAGTAPVAGQRCWWSVSVWDQDSRLSAPGPLAWWERGLEQHDWHGSWIGIDAPDGVHARATPPPGTAPDSGAPLTGLIPSSYLRTSLRIYGPIRRARIYATAKGLYELRLNGMRVSDQLLTPGWTDYDRRIQYQTYDVTDLLHEGENVLAAVVATGWYSGYAGAHERCRNYGTRPQLLLEGRVEYADDRVWALASDATWKATTGPLRYADLQMGEFYDARAELPGWDRPGYDDSAWLPVCAEPRRELLLVADRAEPVQLLQELTPVGITEPRQGWYVVDLGQNIAGWARLRIRGAAGTEVRMAFGEMLNPDGTLYTENLRGARPVDTYVLAGGGEEIYEPRFTIHGFRYVQLIGHPGVPTLQSLTGCVVASNTPPAGTFTCSSELVNQLQRNIEWGQRGNFLSVPTDCPQRDERLGWLGDAQIFVRTACYNSDVAAFFAKWMCDVTDAQSPAGGFPDVAPRMTSLSDGAPAWGDAGIIVPWTIYHMYGDAAIIREHYTSMGRWMDYLQQANPGYLRLGRLNNNFGDWLAIDEEAPTDVLATAYWAYDARLMSTMAHAIGETADHRRYTDLFERIRAAFVAAYVDGQGRIAGDTQTGYVVALHMGLLPSEMRAAAAAHLVDNIRRHDWHLTTGFIGVGYLCPVLTEAGYVDVAYRLLLNETFPSWGYSIRHGATTIWERWDGWTEERGFQAVEMNSFNHYSLGSIGEWLYRYVAGIDVDPERPGFGHIIIRPRPGGGLTHASATYRSIVGLIASAWRLEGPVLFLHVTIPANATATVYVPASEDGDLSEGGIPVAAAAGVRVLERSHLCTILAVASGTYVFRAAYPVG